MSDQELFENFSWFSTIQCSSDWQWTCNKRRNLVELRVVNLFCRFLIPVSLEIYSLMERSRIRWLSVAVILGGLCPPTCANIYHTLLTGQRVRESLFSLSMHSISTYTRVKLGFETFIIIIIIFFPSSLFVFMK